MACLKSLRIICFCVLSHRVMPCLASSYIKDLHLALRTKFVPENIIGDRSFVDYAAEYFIYILKNVFGWYEFVRFDNYNNIFMCRMVNVIWNLKISGVWWNCWCNTAVINRSIISCSNYLLIPNENTTLILQKLSINLCDKADFAVAYR